ncbi:MAG: MmgE/PrpD family protein [Deltaproteobacteria bacterium]|nr:MmgE/PrpD family protein [Deltaproteobacteria bacterium]
MAQRAVTRELAQYIVNLKYEELPQATIQAAKKAVLDQLGIMLMGSTLPWTQPSYEVVRELGGRAESTIVRYGTRVSAPDAAFVNANFGHSCEMDDSGYSGAGHPGSLTVPPAIALGERGHRSGRDLLLAITAGYEVQARLGRIMKPGDKGFHGESVLGPFASVAVSGKLLGLNGEQMVHALSIAGSHSSGTHEYDQSGGEVKRVHASIAVRGGMMAALLAQRGLTGPHTILEGLHGICRVFGGVTDSQVVEMILESLGDNWYAVQGCIFKPFPTEAGMHTSFQAMERLMQEHKLQPDQVEEINLWVNRSYLTHVGSIYEPTDTLSAQFSMAFSLGLRLVKGRNELRDYMDPSLWKDPQIMAVGKKVHMHPDPTMVGAARYGVRMQVRLADGGVMEAEELYRKGSLQNPFTREELEAKFRSLASAVLDEQGMGRVIETVNRLEEVQDISQVVPLLVKH